MNKAISSVAKIFLTVFFVSLTAVSCSSDDIPPLTFNDIGELHMKFTYNGNDYSSDDPVTTTVGVRKYIDATYASGANLKTITIFMPDTPTVGTHFVTAPIEDDAYGAYFTSAIGSVDILADTGTITITSVTDDYVKGTFNFSGPNGSVSVAISNGSFLGDN